MYDDIDVMLFNHGTESVVLAAPLCWQQLADRARRRGRLVALNPTAFPADFSTFARYTKELRKLPQTSRSWSPLPVDEALAGLATDPRDHADPVAPCAVAGPISHRGSGV